MVLWGCLFLCLNPTVVNAYIVVKLGFVNFRAIGECEWLKFVKGGSPLCPTQRGQNEAYVELDWYEKTQIPVGAYALC